MQGAGGRRSLTAGTLVAHFANDHTLYNLTVFISHSSKYLNHLSLLNRLNPTYCYRTNIVFLYESRSIGVNYPQTSILVTNANVLYGIKLCLYDCLGKRFKVVTSGTHKHKIPKCRQNAEPGFMRVSRIYCISLVASLDMQM